MKNFSSEFVEVSRLWRPLVSAACLGAALLATAPARAGLVLSAQTVSVNAGSSGALDVTLYNSGPGAVTIGGFAIEVVSASNAISFTDATISTASPYIFAGHSSYGPSIETLVGQTVDASDAYDTANAGVSIASGETVGIAHLTFTVSSGATGSIAATLSAYPGSSLADALGNNVPITTLTSGAVNINASTAPVPEPATFGPAVLAALVGLWKARSLRRKTA